MKNVLIITRNFPPVVCGVGDYSNELAKHLVTFGIQSSFLTEKTNDWHELNIGDDGLHRLFTTQQFSSSMYKNIINACTQQSVETIFWQYVPYSFARGGLPFYVLLVMLRLRLKGLRQVVFFHEISLRAWGYGLQQWLRAIGQQWISRAMAGISHQNITSIPFYQRYTWPFKTEIIPVGANIFKEPQQKITPVADTIVVFCFSNRVTETLLNAIALVGERVLLQLAGKADKAKEREIKDWIAAKHIFNRVKLHGVLAETTLAELMQSVDLFIQPQPLDRKTEGGVSAKNGTIIAAMGMGLPIITTCGDMTDTHIFKDGENIHFLRAYDEQAYRAAIVQFLDDPAYRKRLAANAKKTYQAYFAWPVIAEKIAPLL